MNLRKLTQNKLNPRMKKGIALIIIILLVLMIINRFTYRENPNRQFITDKDGRILIFHGINVISAAKSDPLRVGGTTQEDFIRIADDWGFNAVRLLIFWDGIEPEPGQYDMEYLDRVRERLDWCEKAGLSVILDMHQDLYSLKFGGDGAPEWAIMDDGQPFEHQSTWELNYLQPAVKASIDNFWRLENGHPELQEHYIDAMVFAVDTLADHPAVIGVDIYNEPTMANLYGLYRFENQNLTPFIQNAINGIRAKHNDIWIFFEPAALGPNQGFHSGLGSLDDPREGDSRLVYFPHLYTLDLDITDKYAGWPIWINFWGHQRQKEAHQFGMPMMVGEFGLNENQQGALDFLREVLVMYDKTTSGWFYWSYDPGSWGLQNQDGEENQKADLLIYPYPQKITGTQPSFSWQTEERIFSLSFSTLDTSENSLATEIYLPPRSWPNGWEMTSHGVEISQSFDTDTNILFIQPKQPGVISITIQDKGQ
jgi:endoglycosylceramidase